MAGVEVLQVPVGSVLVLKDVELGDMASADTLVSGMAEVLGHHKFVVLTITTGAAVEVWGPDTDLEARLTELLKEARVGDQEERPNALTGVPGGAALVPGADEQGTAKRRIPVAADDGEDQAD